MKQVRKRKNTEFDAATHCMSSTSRPPRPHLRSRVDDLRIMTWRWLSFTHIWISLGAFATTLVSGVWFSPDLAWQGMGIPMATWVALSTGLGYTVQRAIKHAKQPQNMPSARQSFWSDHGWKMLVGWGLPWLAFNLRFFDELQWHRPERQMVVALLALASLAYSVVPGFAGGLRKVTWLKVPLIAGVWATATTMHPEAAFEPLLWTQRFIFIASLTLPFDIRDLEVDEHHIQTVASLKSPAWVLQTSRHGMLFSMAMCAAGVASCHLCATPTAVPLIGLIQSAWAWWLLQDRKTLSPLTSGIEEVREKQAGWTLDGVLLAPGWILPVLWLMTTLTGFGGPIWWLIALKPTNHVILLS